MTEEKKKRGRPPKQKTRVNQFKFSMNCHNCGQLYEIVLTLDHLGPVVEVYKFTRERVDMQTKDFTEN